MNPNLSEALQRRLELFLAESGLPKEIADELIGHHTTMTYPEGATLFLQGAPADVLFWISSGVVEVLCPQEDGSRIRVRRCGPGEMVGYVDFFDHKNRRAQQFEAYALVKSEIALITRDRIRKLLAALEPAQLIQLLEYLNTMWSSTVNSWASFVGLDYRQRLEIVFKDLAARFGVADARGTLLITPLLHNQLAEMIGSSRPMITRIIEEMVEEGVLARSGKQYILLNRTEPAANGRMPESSRANRTPHVPAAKTPALGSRNGSDTAATFSRASATIALNASAIR